MFKPVSNKLNIAEKEEKILDFWEENKIFEKGLELRKDAPMFAFYEGPPTANGKPGIHHVMARTVKDIVCRYKTMKGFLVERKAVADIANIDGAKDRLEQKNWNSLVIPNSTTSSALLDSYIKDLVNNKDKAVQGASYFSTGPDFDHLTNWIADVVFGDSVVLSSVAHGLTNDTLVSVIGSTEQPAGIDKTQEYII